MNSSDIFSKPDYIRVSDEFERLWRYILSRTRDTVVAEVCFLRNYYTDHVYTELLETGIGLITRDDTEALSALRGYASPDTALFSAKGNFILEDRYILPIRDVAGRILAFVGWYPDTKKYITTPSKYFSKANLFFGMEKVPFDRKGTTVLVEGIFDTIALRSCGLNVLGTMGSSISEAKQSFYPLLGSVVGIPDTDPTGRRTLRGDLWGLGGLGSYLLWDRGLEAPNPSDGEDPIKLKDIDDLVKVFEPESIREEVLKASLNPFTTTRIDLQ